MIANLAAGVQAFTSNAFLVTGERTVLVDAGANFDVVSAVRDRTVDLDALVLTHTHPDHVGNVSGVREAFGVEVWGHDPDHPAVDHAIRDGESVRLGDHEYRALHTPGHKDDHLCFYAASPEILFAGDLIFQNGGFGRTDLPEGDRETLIGSIDRVAETISSDLAELHPGHGPSVEGDAYGHIELAGQAARMSF
ncbi:MBL fold metallo-hydrolase [Halalkalicoccus sp. NIPERK01]|uniref:MBL fold metallo-hydrolase n=1 Tax=Halalkalicoccus sp. NIPERK01 TaxID=3053469 RepID=UPI00256EB462|nr:MBL fold metallo-hydrolase [Halalkalicoccus sp. NIPERK01]MDL5360957.1 MBL fold metallo-hydrolase [Halalkalicoccus sp. NIPERK01]